MKRTLPILMLMAGLLWLAPAVQALPLASDQGFSGAGEPVALPEMAHVDMVVPEPASASRLARGGASPAPEPHASRRGVPQLLYVGLLGLLILGIDLGVGRRMRRGRGAAPPIEAPPSRRRDPRYSRVRL